MVELKGSLGSIGLPAIVQLIGELHHSGTLQLGRRDAVGVLDFADGRLVAAEFGQERGLKALASCALTMATADFTFIEAPSTAERTLDLGPAELKKLLDRVRTGDSLELEPEAPVSPGTQIDEDVPACPLLGFADDRDRHYSRITPLHRCYADSLPSLVTSDEQHNLCLSGRYAACARYRNNKRASHGATPVGELPPSVVQAAPPPALPTRAAEAPAPTTRPKMGRASVLVAGAVLGLVLGAAVLIMVVPSLTSGPTQKPSTILVSGVEATPPPTASLSAPVAGQASAPTVGPTPTALSRPPTPTLALPPTVAAESVGPSLMDVGFASGPVSNWLANPFATWSDGAYRLQAKQATQFVAVGIPIDRVLSDVVVSARLRKTGGPPGGGYGLIVRDEGPGPRDGINQEAHAYVLETGDLGEFGIWRRDGDHWVDLVPWTHSNSVRPGGSPNDLVVRAVGDRLTLTVNGTQVASVQDDTLLVGGVGVFVGGDYNEVALDHFAVQLPD